MPTYALTTGTYQRRYLFSSTSNADLIVDLLFHYRDQGRYQLHGFVVMPEHLHILLTPSLGQTIERCAQCIKGGFSHALGKQSSGAIWQPGFHEHRIRNGIDFVNQIEYIANNPRRRGIADFSHVHTRFLDRIDPMPAELRQMQAPL